LHDQFREITVEDFVVTEVAEMEREMFVDHEQEEEAVVESPNNPEGEEALVMQYNEGDEENLTRQEDVDTAEIDDDEEDEENVTDLEEEENAEIEAYEDYKENLIEQEMLEKAEREAYEKYREELTDHEEEERVKMEAYEEDEENYTDPAEEYFDHSSGNYDLADADIDEEGSTDIEEEDYNEEYTDIENEGFVEYTEAGEEDKIDETQDAADSVLVELEDLAEEGATEARDEKEVDGSVLNNGDKEDDYTEDNDTDDMSMEDLYTEEDLTRDNIIEEYSFDDEEGSAAATQLERELLNQQNSFENTDYKSDIDAAYIDENGIEDSYNDRSDIGTAVKLEPVAEDEGIEDNTSNMDDEDYDDSRDRYKDEENKENMYNAEISATRGKKGNYDISSVFLPDPEESPVFLRPHSDQVEVQMRSADAPELTADISSWALHSDNSAGPRMTSNLATLISTLLTSLILVSCVTRTV